MTLSLLASDAPAQLSLPLGSSSAHPIVKWVGGKGGLLAQLRPLLPKDLDGRPYYEPFLGGAAMYFALRPQRAWLSDANAALCDMYLAVRDELDAVTRVLKRLATVHSRENYYRVRNAYNRTAREQVLRAAMFLYLNRACFNGLHRLNRSGYFNVPAGDLAQPWTVDEGRLRAASRRLASASLTACSFEHALSTVPRAAFVYLDPPYEPTTARSGFTRYNGHEFGARECDALHESVCDLDARGVTFMLSNSDSEANRKRYARFDIARVSAGRRISCKPSTRGATHELVIRNYA